MQHQVTPVSRSGRYEVRDTETGEVLTRKLVLDVSVGEKGPVDRAARAAMHAYMTVRGVDPGERRPEHEGLYMTERWYRMAQELADSPDPDCRVSNLSTENVAKIETPVPGLPVVAALVDVSY